METEQKTESSGSVAYRTERIIASLVMAWVIILTSYMIFQERSLSQESMYFLKILISLSGAVMLATLPGFFDISYGISGLTIRAAGGAAAFVFIFTQSPNIPNFHKETVAPHSAPAVTRPGTSSSIEHRDSSIGHRDSDALPVLVSLSIDPMSVASLASGGTTNGGSEGTGAWESTILVDQEQTPSGVPSSMLATAMTAVQGSAARLADGALHLLERIANALRDTVSWVGVKAMALLENLRAPKGMLASDIQAFIVSIPQATADLVNTAAAPAVAAVDHLGEQMPVLDGLGDTVANLPGILTTTVGNTVNSVGDLVGGILHAPTDTLALTGKAVGDLTENLAGTTKEVLAATRGLAQGVNAQVSAITEKLNDVAPALISPISPTLQKLDVATSGFHDAIGDVTSALPPLTAVLGSGEGLTLPPLPIPAVRGIGGQVIGGQVEEVRGGCEHCVLQPLNLGSRGDGTPGGGLLGGRLGGIGLGNGPGGGSGAASSGTAGSVGGIGRSGGGAVSSAVGGLGSAVGNTTRGLLGRR